MTEKDTVNSKVNKTMPNSNKRKRSSSSVLPNKLLSELESTDKKAAKLRKSLISSQSVPKSLAAQSQVEIHGNLIECRILLQKALSSLPHLQTDENVLQQKEDKEHVKADVTSTVNLNEIQKNSTRLLKILIKTRAKLDTQHDSDDNDDDEGGRDDSISNDAIQQQYSKWKPTWETILNRRHSMLRLSSSGNEKSTATNTTKFQTIDQSFWSQVQSTLRHEHILNESNHSSGTGSGDDRNTPLFDDSKIYRHMLQEFITLNKSMSSSTNASNSTSATNLAAERLRKLLEKKQRNSGSNGNNSSVSGVTGDIVDRKASKGRKIRYVVHDKLMNFAFPVQRSYFTTIDEDVLFKSMFGGVLKYKKK
jgi:protein AATF/BFR2